MASGQLNTVIRHLYKLVDDRDREQLSDGQLLNRFVKGRDESAFAALVERHGPMVLGVCRRVLHDSHAAEDAFQATFLVLFRRARFLNRRGSLANWLYTVAYHVALRARAGADRRQRHERQVQEMAQTQAKPEAIWGDLQPVLDEEMNRLPDKYRHPVVLCYLQGKTNEEAARLLGWPVGTVKGRLARARELLRARLTRRGVTHSAAVVGTVLAEKAQAMVPAKLVEATLKTTVLWAAGNAGANLASVPAAALAEGVLKAMFVTKLKIATAIILAIGMAGWSVGHLAQKAWAQRTAGAPTKAALRGPAANDQEQPELRLARADNPPSPRSEKAKPDAPKEITITGRVLGPDSKPLPGAQVAVLESPRQTSRPGEDTDKGQALAQTKSGPDGQFQLTVLRASPRPLHFPDVVASAPGFGLGWQRFDPEAERAAVLIRLPPEQVLRGRLVDLQGQPAANVKVWVRWVAGVSEPISVSSVWPGPLTTDAQGRFVLGGVGREEDITLQVRDDGFARQELRVTAAQKDRTKEITFPLNPPHVLSGRITFADTGKPVAGARLMVMASGGKFFGQADADGLYQIPVGDTKGVSVYAAPAKGQPYSTLKKHSDWPKGTVQHSVDLALPKGIRVKGRITESPSGKPVAAANIQYFPQQTDNPHLRPDLASLWPAAVDSGSDGEFEIALPPGPAHLLITGPTSAYIHQEVAYTVLADSKADYHYGRYSFAPEGNAYFGGQRVYAHAVVAVNLKRGTDPDPLSVTLKRGATVRGRLVGADDKPVARAWMLSRLNVSIWDHIVGFPVDVFDGRFELHGCDPKASYRVIFFDTINQQGAVADLFGKQTEAVTVRLAPCGTAKARLVDEKGQPLRKTRPWIGMVVTPGGGHFQSKELHADTVWLANLDSVRYGDRPRTDAEGRLTLPALIPGATYRFDSPGWITAPFKDCLMQSSKTVDWGDIVNPAVFDETE